MIFPDDGNVDTNDQEDKDIVQEILAEEKTIIVTNEVFDDHCDALGIYKQEDDQIMDQIGTMSWYFYAGDMRLSNVFVLGFNKDIMKGIQYKVWNQHFMAGNINSVFLMVTTLPSYNWRT